MNVRKLLKSNSQSAKLMQPGDRTFYNPPRFSQSAAVGFTAFDNNGLNVFFAQLVSMGLRVVTAIGLNDVWLGFWVSDFAFDMGGILSTSGINWVTS